MPTKPDRYPCPTCEGWGTVVPAPGARPVPCPEPDCPIRTAPRTVTTRD